MAFSDKTADVISKMEQGIKDTFDSDKFKDYLRIQSKFHNYSYSNTMLIYLQNPNATKIAGYGAWQKNFERQVLKGEKAITILAPAAFKYESLINKVDPVTKEPVIDPKTGTPEQVKKLSGAYAFTTVSVFDISQTDGKELPKICEELKGNSTTAKDLISAMNKISEVPITYQPIPSGSKGFYVPSAHTITIKSDMSDDQTAKTLMHEYAHSQLHSKNSNASHLSRSDKEVQAESVAFIVCDRYGIDTSEYSFNYLANWSSTKDLPELKAALKEIQNTANDIITKLDNELINALTHSTEPVKVEILFSESSQFQKGEIMTLKEADERFFNAEAEGRDKNAELKERGESYGYDKTKFTVHLEGCPPITDRFDIGSNHSYTITDHIAETHGINLKHHQLCPELNALITKHHDTISDTLFKSTSESRLKILEALTDSKLLKDFDPKFVEFFEAKTQSLQQLFSKGFQNKSTDGYQIIKDIEQTMLKDIKAAICSIYKDEFEAIDHLSENSILKLFNINKSREIPYSIEDLKEMYKTTGKMLEQGEEVGPLFTHLKELLSDLTHAKGQLSTLSKMDNRTTLQVIAVEMEM